MTYFLMATGCQMNLSDTERIKTVLNKAGCTESDEDTADILGFVACSVRQKAIDKVFSRIHKWNKEKNQRNLITFLTGCVLPEDKTKFLKLFDLVFETKEILHLPEMISQYGVVTGGALKYDAGQDDFWNISPDYQSKYEAFIPIQNGCNNFCTYCAVPYTRGREVSRPSSEILEEYDTLLKTGYKSVTLLGQNVNSYGLDMKGTELSFPVLLDRMGTMADSSGKRTWIYFTAPHPKDMTDEVIDVMAAHDSIAKQMHLPLQSGDNDILKRMNRHYTVEDFARIVDYARKRIPDLSLFTDIIVGFPGETDSQFENTRKAMERFRFNMAFIARYSSRPGAASSRWDDDIPYEVKKTRLHILTEALKESALAANKAAEGKTLPVLVTGVSRGGTFLAGLTEGKINVQFPSKDINLSGRFVDVEITGVGGISLEGIVLRNH